MSLRFYDEAVKNKIARWVLDPKITITSPDETRRLFSYRADIRDDKPIQLPLIALRRGKDVDIKNPYKRPTSFDAVPLRAIAGGKIQSLSNIGVVLRYQLDIYTREFAECDEYARNFIFKIANNPSLEVQIPYNEANASHVFNMQLDGTYHDNSDIPERLVPGQFTRFTIPFSIPDAYLFAAPVRDTWSVECDTKLSLASDLNSSLDASLGVEATLSGAVGVHINEVDASKIKKGDLNA